MDNAVHICDPIDPAELAPLHDMLSSITIPIRTANRTKMLNSRYMWFGLVKERITNRIGISAESVKYPHIWEEIQRIGKMLKNRDGSPFIYTSVHLNNDVHCEPHRDKNNIGPSIIFGFGDYEGGELCLESGEKFDINSQPVLFNGATLLHWNTPLTKKGKYSLVFYIHRCALIL